MDKLPAIDFILWNTVIVLLINGEIRQFVPYGDYNKQDVLASIQDNTGIGKLELLDSLPVIWSRT